MSMVSAIYQCIWCPVIFEWTSCRGPFTPKTLLRSKASHGHTQSPTWISVWKGPQLIKTNSRVEVLFILVHYFYFFKSFLRVLIKTKVLSWEPKPFLNQINRNEHKRFLWPVTAYDHDSFYVWLPDVTTKCSMSG